ncbi:hypothetical protein, partial [Phocaeicola dorei]|uniref:hypothetical protein n=1 Tax=Phocaeicola dorei TaxID=357276 RepID=UPI0032EF4BB1
AEKQDLYDAAHEITQVWASRKFDMCLNGNSVHTIPKCAKLSLTGAFSVVFCIKIEYGSFIYTYKKRACRRDI